MYVIKCVAALTWYTLPVTDESNWRKIEAPQWLTHSKSALIHFLFLLTKQKCPIPPFSFPLCKVIFTDHFRSAKHASQSWVQKHSAKASGSQGCQDSVLHTGATEKAAPMWHISAFSWTGYPVIYIRYITLWSAGSVFSLVQGAHSLLAKPAKASCQQ